MVEGKSLEAGKFKSLLFFWWWWGEKGVGRTKRIKQEQHTHTHTQRKINNSFDCCWMTLMMIGLELLPLHRKLKKYWKMPKRWILLWIFVLWVKLQYISNVPYTAKAALFAFLHLSSSLPLSVKWITDTHTYTHTNKQTNKQANKHFWLVKTNICQKMAKTWFEEGGEVLGDSLQMVERNWNEMLFSLSLFFPPIGLSQILLTPFLLLL